MGITFDAKFTFHEHIEDIVTRAKKRLNLLKALRGQSWGASPHILMYSYKSYIRPILEYGSVLFSHAKEHLLKRIQAVETDAIKLAFRLAPWATNTNCYKQVNFEPILPRLKALSQNFINQNQNDDLIKPLIENSKPSLTGHHSPLYKILNF